MDKAQSDIDFLICVTEGSRLIREKKFDFALLLLDSTPEVVSEMADRIRKDKDLFEMIALNSLSDRKLIRIREGEHFLTYDQLQLKNAMTEASE